MYLWRRNKSFLLRGNILPCDFAVVNTSTAEFLLHWRRRQNCAMIGKDKVVPVSHGGQGRDVEKLWSEPCAEWTNTHVSSWHWHHGMVHTWSHVIRPHTGRVHLSLTWLHDNICMLYQMNSKDIFPKNVKICQKYIDFHNIFVEFSKYFQWIFIIFSMYLGKNPPNLQIFFCCHMWHAGRVHVSHDSRAWLCAWQWPMLLTHARYERGARTLHTQWWTWAQSGLVLCVSSILVVVQWANPFIHKCTLNFSQRWSQMCVSALYLI